MCHFFTDELTKFDSR